MSNPTCVDEANTLLPDYHFIDKFPPSGEKVVFHARTRDDQDVCVKFFNPLASIDRISREVGTVGMLDSPYFAKLVKYIRQIDPISNLHYVVEEFVEGEDLTEFLARSSPFNVELFCEFWGHVASALAVLQAHSIVHRDLKPANIRVRPDGLPVIIDFGLVRLLEAADLTLTIEGARKGSHPYLSPEQWTGTKYDIDPRTDIFAVGVMMYESLAGVHPFWERGETITELAEKVCNQNPCFGETQFKESEGLLQLITNRCLSKERARRPDAIQLAELLSRVPR